MYLAAVISDSIFANCASDKYPVTLFVVVVFVSVLVMFAGTFSLFVKVGCVYLSHHATTANNNKNIDTFFTPILSGQSGAIMDFLFFSFSLLYD